MLVLKKSNYFQRYLKRINGLDRLSTIFLSIFLFYILYFSYIALTTTPLQINESDSLGQHIPLAKAILDGKLFNPPSLHRGLGFYLPIGEIILAFFIKLNIPLGFYNILPFLLLFYLSYKLAFRLKLNDSMSIVFASAVCSINSILRLVPTQKNDIWVDIFFIWTLYLLLKPRKNWNYFLMLGFSTGLLIGVKYSGIIYIAILFLVLSKKLRKYANIRNTIAFIVPVFFFGLIWYLRNYLITHDPFYPVSMLGFQGNPEFIVPRGYQNFSSWRYVFLAAEAFASEYLIWSFTPLLLVYIFFKNNKFISSYKPIFLIAILSLSTYLLAPTEFTRVNFTSNIRFTHVSFVLFILILFVLAKKLKKDTEIKTLAVLNSVAVFPMLSYFPKLIIIWFIILVLVYFYILLFKAKDNDY